MLNINDVVKVSRNIREDISAGHLGTVVHIFDQNPPVYLIEFIDNESHTIEIASSKGEDMSLYWVASTEKYVE